MFGESATLIRGELTTEVTVVFGALSLQFSDLEMGAKIAEADMTMEIPVVEYAFNNTIASPQRGDMVLLAGGEYDVLAWTSDATRTLWILAVRSVLG